MCCSSSTTPNTPNEASTDVLDSHSAYHRQPSLNVLTICRQMYADAKQFVFEKNVLMLGLTTEPENHLKPDVQSWREQMILDQYKDMISAPDDALAQAKRPVVVADADQVQDPASISLLFKSVTALANLSIAIPTSRLPTASSAPSWIVLKPPMHQTVLKGIFCSIPPVRSR